MSEDETPPAGGEGKNEGPVDGARADWTDNGSSPGHTRSTGKARQGKAKETPAKGGGPMKPGRQAKGGRSTTASGQAKPEASAGPEAAESGGAATPDAPHEVPDAPDAAPDKPAFWPEFMEGAAPRDLSKPLKLTGSPSLSVDFPLGLDGSSMPDDLDAPAYPAASMPPSEPAKLYWSISIQTINVAKLDQYLESVSDQENAMREDGAFGGRLVLRSQKRPERFWVIDAWDEEYAMTSAAIRLRTLSSVAGMADEPRAFNTVEIPTGRGELVRPGAELRLADAPLPFYLIAENWAKPVRHDEYVETQSRYASELEEEAGFHRRMLLRDITEPIHYFCIDEWASEQAAYEAFEQRQGRLTETTMTMFLTLVAERGEPDFALGIHG